MNIINFPNFNNILEEIITKGTHNDLSLDTPISSQYLDDFIIGVLGICNCYDHLLAERGYTIDDLKNEELIKKLHEEDMQYLEDIDFTDVELKKRRLTLMEYGTSIAFYGKVLDSLSETNDLSKRKLKDIILEKPSKIIYRQENNLILEDARLFSFDSHFEALTAALEFTSVSNLMSIFQQCQVLQSGDKEQMDYMIWDIYSNEADVTIDEVSEGLEFTGIKAMRLPELISAEGKIIGPRDFFDNVRIFAARDAFRQYIARKIEIFDEQKSLLLVNGEYETLCFAKQYQDMDLRKRKNFDREAQIQLRKLSLRYQIPMPSQTPKPFTILPQDELNYEL